MNSNNKSRLLTEQHAAFLEQLRLSGKINMWGAAPYLQRAFKLNPADAKTILVGWIESKRA